jgi:hypothetical protein
MANGTELRPSKYLKLALPILKANAIITELSDKNRAIGSMIMLGKLPAATY